MTLEQLNAILPKLTPQVMQNFVHAARTFIDSVAVEAAAVAAKETPGATDYRTANHDRSPPTGGWIDFDEVRQKSKQMTEAIAAEKFADGVITTLQALALFGAI